jgi:hypothetical protein
MDDDPIPIPETPVSLPGNAHMPNLPIFTFVPKVNDFIAHWTSVNAALGSALTLPGGYVLASLTADRDSLNTLYTAVVTTDNTQQVAAGDRDTRRASQREKMRQFRMAVQGQLAGSTYVNALPTLFRKDAKEGDVLAALRDIANIWSLINTTPPAGFTAPLLLNGPFTMANFNTALSQLVTAYATYASASEGSTLARENRNALINPVIARLVQYRLAVQGAFPAGNALIASLPALYPPAGSTPKGVNLSGVWNAGTVKADLTWSASTNPDLDHYAVRYHPGPKYKAAEEQPVDIVAAGTTTLSTDYGLVASGSTALFKVYVVTSTGNEKGSNSVKVIRP